MSDSIKTNIAIVSWIVAVVIIVGSFIAALRALSRKLTEEKRNNYYERLLSQQDGIEAFKTQLDLDGERIKGRVIRIGDCQYFKIKIPHDYNIIVHKGDCDNPIHPRQSLERPNTNIMCFVGNTL